MIQIIGSIWYLIPKKQNDTALLTFKGNIFIFGHV